MFHWLHHLINPHCHECQIQAVESKVCESCETLKMQLAIANREKEQMLQSILSFNKPSEEIRAMAKVDPEEVKPKMMTWNVRRQLLEAEDRIKAKVLAEQAEAARIAKSIADLEKETGVAQEEKKEEVKSA